MLGGDMGVAANERTIRWLRAELPGLRFLVLVKSPADRFMSNPLATRKLERLQESLVDGTNAMPPKLAQILSDNCYVDKLAPWLDAFPPERFLVLKSEDLRGAVPTRQKILDEVHVQLKLFMPPASKQARAQYNGLRAVGGGAGLLGGRGAGRRVCGARGAAESAVAVQRDDVVDGAALGARGPAAELPRGRVRRPASPFRGVAS